MRVLAAAVLAACAALTAEETVLDRVEFAAPVDAVARTVRLPGATLSAAAPTRVDGALTLEPTGPAGLTASVVARSLRATVADDWRAIGVVAGDRRDKRIDLPTTRAGTPAERKRFAVAGTDEDWDDFSIQWDGWLRVDRDGTSLAVESDDGARVWIDVNGDGEVQPGEWSDGWGLSHGAELRPAQAGLKAGSYRLRVQWEDGGGPNCMQLLWNAKRGRAYDKTWRVIPDEAFAHGTVALIDGPATLVGAVSGAGATLRLARGARLATAPRVATVEIADRAALAGDVDLGDAALHLDDDARLACAGHALTTRHALAGGVVALEGGRLALPAGEHEVAIEGPGTLVAAAGVTRVRRFAPDVAVAGDDAIVRDAVRCVARLESAAPLSRVVPVADEALDAGEMIVDVDVPVGAPDDLGIGAWRADRDGAWYQTAPEHLAPGRARLRLRLDALARLAPEGHAGRWSAEAAATAARAGLYLYSSRPGRGLVRIDARVAPAAPAATVAAPRIADVALDDLRDGVAHATAGVRWQLGFRPTPWPANPYDPAAFSADLEVVEPDGATRRFAAFADEPVRLIDDGDRERFVATAAPLFRVRFRARAPGRHRLRLIASWRGGAPLAVPLPDLVVAGPPWDDIVRPDPGDPRFFSAGGKFVWPIGHNLNSVYDVRSRAALHTKLTPNRGSFARAALLERLAAMGGTGCETWLSAWNMGLEWSTRWPGYAGTGRYNPGHAAALDDFLDRAERLGVRVNLSIFNHGMARDGENNPEAEWPFHPWHDVNGGWLQKPAGLFADARAFVSQCAYFRYLAARWGDSPALLGWKLWAEVNLANAPHDDVVAWHARAAKALRAADPYGRGVTTHWCGDWHSADSAIARQTDIGYLTIDAYHGDNQSIADVLAQSVADPAVPGSGLVGYRKPVVVTEFGGSAGGCAPARMAAEYAIGPWAALTTGHATAPMLWWFEWIDQRPFARPYAAVRAYLDGEDLRGADAQPIAPSATGVDARGAADAQPPPPGTRLWCRAWTRPHRMLGYVLDPLWAVTGGEGRRFAGGTVIVGEEVAAQDVTTEWWDCDTGVVIARVSAHHPGGRLELQLPAFARHLAFKLVGGG